MIVCSYVERGINLTSLNLSQRNKTNNKNDSIETLEILGSVHPETVVFEFEQSPSAFSFQQNTFKPKSWLTADR
jgi:hypothetical protein